MTLCCFSPGYPFVGDKGEGVSGRPGDSELAAGGRDVDQSDLRIGRSGGVGGGAQRGPDSEQSFVVEQVFAVAQLEDSAGRRSLEDPELGPAAESAPSVLDAAEDRFRRQEPEERSI